MVTWISALSKTRHRLHDALSRVFSRPAGASAASFDELEEGLVQADVPARMAAQLIQDLARSYEGLRVDPREMLAKVLNDRLKGGSSFSWESSNRPAVILVVGVNGSGKTTTCAKIARLAERSGRSVLLGAADTFRAAGSHQLKIWADRVGCDVVTGRQGADAAAVAYDALDAAIARSKDVLVVDTAGRMHTREPLMRELQKTRGAIAKRMPGAPHETWIVLDATMGQNAVIQARMFHDAVPLTGAVIAKLDGSAKAGFVFGVRHELGIPICFAGLGEGPDDLVPFDADAFVAALLDEGKESVRP